MDMEYGKQDPHITCARILYFVLHGTFIFLILVVLMNTAYCIFDVCDPSPSKNGGLCVVLNQGTAVCVCPDAYTGVLCEFPVPQNDTNFDPCDINPCGVDGQCNGPTGFCECTNSFGLNCSLSEAPCSPSPCRNGGLCIEVFPILFVCACIPPFIGVNCDIEDLCFQNPCENDGTCELVSVGEFVCECMEGFVGDTCQFQDPCKPNPCENGGTCDNSNAPNFTCECVSGFLEPICNITDPCEANPCEDGGTCDNSNAPNFTCECVSGFLEPNCNITVEENDRSSTVVLVATGCLVLFAFGFFFFG